VEDQFALRQLISEYLIPIETNVIWYALGGVLAIALTLEVLTGVLLSLVYQPDAGLAYGITKGLIESPGWSVVINFHYWNSFLIFGLVMIHMMRVFVTGGYRGEGHGGGKQGMWLGGVVLAGCVFLAATTGEALHWDEVGFAVPWHVSEVFQALGIASAVNYTFAELRYIPTATFKLQQIYALHVSVVPIVAGLFLVLHYYLIKVKGVSMPFWRKPSGVTAPFSTHIREWAIYGGVIMGVILLMAIVLPRDPGIAPQLLPTSPLFGAAHGPGALGSKPTFPIGWTHGMNLVFGDHLGIDPDIWGTVVGLAVMTLALLAVPFLDRGKSEPRGWHEAFDLRKRGWAFAAIALFWGVLLVASVTNYLAEAG
jgi:quinol-cytochrome oxidoreductase complex cytochrome b subunit